MPTYRYKCPSCSFEFDVIKQMSECDTVEKCETCGRGNIEGSCRMLGTPIFYGEKQDEAFYSIPLGKMVKSKKAMRQMAKDRGWEELGTTDIHRNIDSMDRAREQKSADSYAEFSAPITLNDR